MGRDEEKRFLQNRLEQLNSKLESRRFELDRDRHPGKQPPDGVDHETVRYQIEKRLIEKLLAEQTEVRLQERLMKAIRERESDEIEDIKEGLLPESYSERFWSDEFYIEVLEDLVNDWLDVKGKEEAAHGTTPA